MAWMLKRLIGLVNDDLRTEDDTPLFFQSYRQFKEICNIKNQNQIVRTITLFAALHFLDKVPEEKIPENIIKNAKRIAAQNKQKKLTNFFSIQDYGISSLKESEKLAKILKDNHLRTKSLSREYFMRTFDKNDENFAVDKIYPQFVYENSKIGTSDKSNDFTVEIALYMMNAIENKGYVTEAETVESLAPYHKSKECVDRQLKKSLPEILYSYNWKRIRANKIIKETYNVQSGGFPFIIIPNIKSEINITFLKSPETEKAINNVLQRLKGELNINTYTKTTFQNFNMKYFEDICRIIVEEQDKQSVKIHLNITKFEYEEVNNKL